MNEHNFKMKLSCNYDGPENNVNQLKVENLVDGKWQEFDFDTKTPGFLVFTYSIFTCQHLFLRKSSEKQGVLLDSSIGTLELTASEDWKIQRIHIKFQVRLKSVGPSEEDIKSIANDMRNCPVSRNLKEIPDIQTIVEFKS